MHQEINKSYHQILEEIGFSFIHPYQVAGMGEPWSMKLNSTLELLQEHNIGAILTLMENNLYYHQYCEAGFLSHHESVDDCMPPTAEAMDRAIEFIDHSLSKGLGVAVHCFEGRGRTATVLAAWIGKKESLDPQRAIERVYKARPHSIITKEQRAFLCNYIK
ncbi:MAG: dual specificity protein phosphatase family protein [Spirochaetota bacterium]|nr:dual specificity protein phosphatase family protein [Spirochaetota bacterium]